MKRREFFTLIGDVGDVADDGAAQKGGSQRRVGILGSCVKKTRERHAVQEMKEDPSEPSCRGRLQTAISCFGQKPRW